MMKGRDERCLRLTKALKTAYAMRDKGAFPKERSWELSVMRRVRRIAEGELRPDFSALFELFVWRLAPVTGVMIILLSVLLFRADLSSEYALAGNLLVEPLGEMFLHTFGI